MNRSIQKSIYLTKPKSKAVLRTNGRVTELVAAGPAANFLAGVLGICVIALTINAIAKS